MLVGSDDHWWRAGNVSGAYYRAAVVVIDCAGVSAGGQAVNGCRSITIGPEVMIRLCASRYGHRKGSGVSTLHIALHNVSRQVSSIYYGYGLRYMTAVCIGNIAGISTSIQVMCGVLGAA